MFRYWRKPISTVALSALLLLQGCATTDQRVDIVYRPVAAAQGGSGDVYLVQTQQKPSSTVQYVLGRVTDKEGKRTASVVSNSSPYDLALDALGQELKAAGYRVVLTATVPANAEKALSLKSVEISVDEVRSVFKEDANCSAKIKVERWRNGMSQSILGYEAGYSETAVTEKDVLLSRTLQRTMQLLMKNLVPDVVRQLEAK